MPPDAPFEPVVLVELPRVVPPLTHVRGAAMLASFQVLGEMGLREQLVSAFPSGFETRFAQLTASSWVAIDVVMTYYRLVDALDLPPDQIARIGRLSAERSQSAFLATILRGLRGVVTPTTLLARMDRFWTRSSRGGAPRAVQTGPREIRIEVHGAAFLDLRYNRIALMGYYEHAVSPVAKHVSLRELPRPGPKAAAWNVTWT